MAAITKDPDIGPSLATGAPGPPHTLMGIANETIAAGDACRVSGVTARDEPLFVRSNGAAATRAAAVYGYAARDAKAGEALTLFYGVEYGGYTGLTPDTAYYLSGTVAGGLDTTASTGGTKPIAYAITAERIYVMRKLDYL